MNTVVNIWVTPSTTRVNISGDAGPVTVVYQPEENSDQRSSGKTCRHQRSKSRLYTRAETSDAKAADTAVPVEVMRRQGRAKQEQQ